MCVTAVFLRLKDHVTTIVRYYEIDARSACWFGMCMHTSNKFNVHDDLSGHQVRIRVDDAETRLEATCFLCSFKFQVPPTCKNIKRQFSEIRIYMHLLYIYFPILSVYLKCSSLLSRSLTKQPPQIHKHT